MRSKMNDFISTATDIKKIKQTDLIQSDLIEIIILKINAKIKYAIFIKIFGYFQSYSNNVMQTL